MTKPVSLPDPAEYPVAGDPKLRLLEQLKWYLEDYLKYPADAVVSTLKAWGAEALNRLFDCHACKWYSDARSDLDALQIKNISSSPAVLS